MLIGIFLLIVEVRQNQEIMELDQKLSLLDSASLEVARYTELRILQVQDREVAQIWVEGSAGRPLDPIDQRRFESMCRSGFWADTLMYERSVALGREVTARGTVESVKRQLRENPGMRDCWRGHSEGLRSRWGYSDFVDAVESE